jgi:threonine synthase
VFALDVARRTGGSIDSVTDEEIVDGIRLLAETTGIFTETAGGVTTAVLRKLADSGRLGPDDRVVVFITGEGLKTLDAVRDVVTTYDVEPSVESFADTVPVEATV